MKVRGLIASACVLAGSALALAQVAATFDGADDLVTATTSGFQGADSAGTIAAWIKLDITNLTQTIVGSSDQGATLHWISFGVAINGLITIGQRNNDTTDWVTGNTKMSPATWYHVVVTSSGTAWALYVNGVPESLTTFAGSNTGDWFADTNLRDNMTIGVLTRSSSIQYFKGRIASVHMWENRALSATEIAALFHRPMRTIPHSLFAVFDFTRMGVSTGGALTNGTIMSPVMPAKYGPYSMTIADGADSSMVLVDSPKFRNARGRR